MQDKDPFAFQFKNNQISSSRPAETSLITLERAQKLDLLIHLISNLRQSLAICGPNGIGKTTLLDELKARKHDEWLIITIQATSNLSFEGIQKQIHQFLIKHNPELKSQELSSALSSLDKKGQKIVVLIDDAGQLVPGLISSVIQYAVASECLRVVFSLTQDELHLKNSSDKSIDDCHFIEIPPLTEKQCGIFLQNLSGKPNAIVPFGAISEPLVEKLYRQTHGIPGKILTELPKLSDYKESASYSWLAGVFLLAIAVTAGLVLFIFDEPDKTVKKETTKTTLALKKAEVIEVAPSPAVILPEVIKPEIIEPVIEVEAIGPEINLPKVEVLEEPRQIQKQVDEIKPTEPAVESDNKEAKLAPPEAISNIKVAVVEKIEKVEIKEKLPQVKELDKKQPVQNQVEEVKTKEPIAEKKEVFVEKTVDIKKVKAPEIKKSKVSEPEKTKNDDSQWLLNQPKNNYTIQLMVLSKRKSVDEFLTKNKKLKEQIKFFQLDKKAEKYAIIYGSFKNSASASKQMKNLPTKYRKSWVRKMRALQKETKK